ncbi:replication initiation and membrane attachment protein [Marinithermofilum abyssi]|uniref:Replication initiation and membrane attachment protein n=1 Tax=Marinithermofilum abyssi TaxID=1571185 RepID=A0A8J2VFQ4_9BACL|nr:DnaD domain protein [Marinithermofilum abyssi]GGE17582.1 replication initiation and membrane attachment protein [Marinithermofilum abyssi]
MIMTWKNGSPRDGWRSRSRRPLHDRDSKGLFHLYQPLIGAASAGLYMTLYHQADRALSSSAEVKTHLYLMNLLHLPLPDLLEARYRLEGVGLLHTYEMMEDGRRVYEYELVPPLSPGQFFQSDVLSITLLNRLGRDGYRALRKDLDTRTEAGSREKGKEVTKSFQEVYGSLSPVDMASVDDLEEEIGTAWQEGSYSPDVEGELPVFGQEEDDLSMVRTRLEPLLEKGAWTPEVEKQLREIRFLYQLDDWDLIRALQNPYVTQNGRIAVERLRSFVKSEYRMRFGRPPVVVERKRLEKPSAAKVHASNSAASVAEGNGAAGESSKEEQHFRMLAQVSPLELLSRFQNGRQIPKADMELIEDLIHQYGLPHGVINVLLEYVLYSYDYKLPRPLVEKIAGHWARKNVQTVEQALEMARKEKELTRGRYTPDGAAYSKRKSQRREREDQLPSAVRQGMEEQSKEERSKDWEVDPVAEQRLRAKLQRMNERLNRKKGSS